ncbi:ATP-binding cassette domain-containing protein, partial [Piscirickettsia salmonis]|uniref:ATP-binding cassette domain-containing protein n=1 Tax=Piscirickettsia salmonis TaxID=1238 RepID=UPI000BFAD330
MSQTTIPDTRDGANATPLIDLRQVSKRFGERPVGAAGRALQRLGLSKPPAITRAVDHVDLAVPRGTTLGLVGESGCGKSTVAKLLVGLVAPTRGTLRYGRSRTGGALHPQMIFQDPYASLNPRWRVGAIVAEPMLTHTKMTPAERTARVGDLLKQVGLDPADQSRYPHQFS